MCRTTKHFHLLNSACSRQVAEADPSRFQLNCPRERGCRRVPEVDGPALFLQHMTMWFQRHCAYRMFRNGYFFRRYKIPLQRYHGKNVITTSVA